MDVKIEDLVSIVIPTYNRADLLPEALESALRQTYKNIEIIIVDDGSRDNTGEICQRYIKRYADRQIKYVYKNNGGIGSTLNRGFLESKGRWFKWLSSDDILEDNAVEELVRFANENSMMFVYSDYIYIDEKGNKTGEFIEPTYTHWEEFAANLWQYHIGNGSSSLIHRSVFEKIGGFDTKWEIGEDYHFWLWICLLERIMLYRCPKILLRYRRHPNQLSTKMNTKALKITEAIRREIRHYYIERYGKAGWKDLMKDFKKYRKARPLWRRLIRRCLRFVPASLADQLLSYYKIYKAKQTNKITSKIDDLEWFNPDLEPNTNNAKCHFARYAFAKPYCEGKVVLDVACGCGYGSNELSRVANLVVGVDRNKDALQLGIKKYKTDNIVLIESEIIEFLQDPLKYGYCPTGAESGLMRFDITICLETIEHLPRDLRKTLIEYIPSDILILSFPTPEFIGNSKFHYEDITLAEIIYLLDQHFNNINLYVQDSGGSIIQVDIDRAYLESHKTLAVQTSIRGQNFIIVARRESA